MMNKRNRLVGGGLSGKHRSLPGRKAALMAVITCTTLLVGCGGGGRRSLREENEALRDELSRAHFQTLVVSAVVGGVAAYLARKKAERR